MCVRGVTMDVKSECWRWLLELQGRAEEESTSLLHAAPARRRSGDESSWGSLVHRPPRASRPQSCIEGGLTNDRLPTLDRLQARPTRPQLPAFTERTASMPAFLNVAGTDSLYHLDYPSSHCREWDPSLGDSSLGSLESLESQSEPKTRERAEIKPGPSAQRAKLCCLTPVRMGWLPVRRRVVMADNPIHARSHDNSTSQVKQKRPVTPVLDCSSAEANGSGPGDGGAQWRGAGTVSGFPSPERVTDHGCPQTASKKNHTPSDRVQRVTHAWTSRVLKPESSKLPSNILMGKTQMHRRGSAPQPCPLTAPPNGDSPTPKHSSSLSSITITSRMVSRSSSLPDTRPPPHGGGRASSPVAINKPHTDHKYPNTQHLRQVTAHRQALVIKVTENREQSSAIVQSSDKDSPTNTYPFDQNTKEGYSSSFSNLTTRGSFVPAISNFTNMKNHISPASLNITGTDNHRSSISNVTCSESPSVLPSREPQTSVVLRRKPTIIKVVEQRVKLIKESKETAASPGHRHSYAGTLGTTNSASYAGNPSLCTAKPLIANESSLSGFEAESERRKKDAPEFYRSSLSVQLSSTSLNPPPTEKPCVRVGLYRQRPASCYASLYSPSDPKANRTEPAIQSRSFADIDPARPTPNRFNRRWSTGEEEGRCDEAYPRIVRSAGDVGPRERGCALLEKQRFTLIKVPESSAHSTRSAILALNAAAVISNVKAQSQQRKRVQHQASVRTERPSAGGNRNPESSGADVMHNGAGSSHSSMSEREGCMRERRASTAGASSNLHMPRGAQEHKQPEFIQCSQVEVQQLLITDTSAQKDNTFQSCDRNISEKKTQQLLRWNCSNLSEMRRHKEERKNEEEEKSVTHQS